MNKKTFFGILLAVVFAAVQVNAQDLDHYKKIVKELSSSKYQGRGYAKDGANKAGKYLEKEFAKAGVDEVVCQPFTLDINTFPGKMKMWVDGKKQTPGVDFTVREFNPSIKGEFGLYYIDTANYDSEKIFADLEKPENQNVFVVCDFKHQMLSMRFFVLLKRGNSVLLMMTVAEAPNQLKISVMTNKKIPNHKDEITWNILESQKII